MLSSVYYAAKFPSPAPRSTRERAASLVVSENQRPVVNPSLSLKTRNRLFSLLPSFLTILCGFNFGR